MSDKCCDNCKHAHHYFYVNNYVKLLVCRRKHHIVCKAHHCGEFVSVGVKV